MFLIKFQTGNIAVILAVAHDSFKKIDLNDLMFDSNTVIYDIKSFYSKNLITKRL